MGQKSNIRRHRVARHQHALQRLRERYAATAEVEDIMRLWKLARQAWGRGEGDCYPGTDGMYMLLADNKFGNVPIVYVPRHQAIATVLPSSAVRGPAALNALREHGKENV